MSDEMQPHEQAPATKADLRNFATKTDLTAFATKADFQDFFKKADLNFATKSDLATMRDEIIGAIRIEVGVAVKREVAVAVKREVPVSVNTAIRPLAAEITLLRMDVTDIRSHIKEKLVTRDEFHARMDAFTRRVEDHDWSAAKNRSRLDDHEDRIKALEDGRS